MTGIAIGVMSPLIALAIVILIAPIFGITAALKEMSEVMFQFGKQTHGTATWGFRIADKGLKRMKGEKP